MRKNVSPYSAPSFRPGYSILEVTVAMTLVIIFTSAFTMLTMGSYDEGRQGREQTVATHIALEGLEAARSIDEQDFDNLVDGVHGIDDETGVYTFSGSSNVSGKYTRTVTVASVRRDENNNIVSGGGSLDPDTKAVTSTVGWNINRGRSNTISFVAYLTNWMLGRWLTDLFIEYEVDYRNSTVLTNVDDGEAELGTLGNLKEPEEFYTENLPEKSDIKDIHIDPISDRMYFVTKKSGGGSSKPEFFAYDISNVSREILTLSGSTDLGATSNGFALGTNYAYILMDDKSLEVRVVRLSDFQVVATWDIAGGDDDDDDDDDDHHHKGHGHPNDIVIDETINRAYVVTEERKEHEELYVLDISNPEASTIQILNQVEIGEDVNGIAIRGNYAYLVTDGKNSELQIVDLTNTNNIAECDLLGNEDAVDIEISGTRLFIGRDKGSQTEFIEYTINAADPDNCYDITTTVVGEAHMSDDVIDMSVQPNEGYAFVLIKDDHEELQVVDLSDYSVTTLDLSGNKCDAVAFLGAYIYVGCHDDTNTIQVLHGNPGGWGDPQIAGDGNTPGNDDGIAIAVSGNYVYVGTKKDASGGEFSVFDVSSVGPGLSPIASLEVNEDVNDIFLAGGYAYLATKRDSRELMVVDVSTPQSPVEVGSYDTEKDATAVSVQGTGAYIVTKKAGGDPEFYVLDVSDTGNIEKEGTYEVNGDVTDVIVSGTVAYIATEHNSQEVMSLDISNPAGVTLLGTYDTQQGSDEDSKAIALWNSYLFLVTKNGGSRDDFYILDVSNPAAITKMASLDLDSDNEDITIDSQSLYAFLASKKDNEEFRLMDISSISAPKELATLDLNGDCKSVVYDGTYVYLACKRDSGELQIVKDGPVVSGYPWWGTLTSPPLDSESDTPNWMNIRWKESGNGSVSFRIRTADTEENLKQAQWVGSDGTRQATYTQSEREGIVTDPTATGIRWIQWKAYFTGDGTGTPILEDILITSE